MDVSGLLSSCTTPAAICPNVASLSACDHALARSVRSALRRGERSSGARVEERAPEGQRRAIERGAPRATTSGSSSSSSDATCSVEPGARPGTAATYSCDRPERSAPGRSRPRASDAPLGHAPHDQRARAGPPRRARARRTRRPRSGEDRRRRASTIASTTARSPFDERQVDHGDEQAVEPPDGHDVGDARARRRDLA